MKQFTILWVLMLGGLSSMQAQVTLEGDSLQEVVVTETRHQHALRSTAPMYVVDRKDMTVMGITNMADALHHLSGVTLRDYGGAGGMKTVSVRGFGAKHTGVSYDGVILSECQSGEIDLSRYSLDNVDYLSLTIGDNSDIFIPARNASTPATLTIQTLRQPSADHRAHLTAQIKAGSFDYLSPFLRYEQCLSSRLSFSFVGEYAYAKNDYPYIIKNGIETIHARRNNSRMNSGHAEMNFLWDMGVQSLLAGKVYYYDNDRQLPGQVFYYNNTSKETLRDRNFFGQLSFRKRWDERLSLRLLAKYNWTASLYDDGAVANWSQDGDYFQREAYTSACLLYTPADHWAFDYSADYVFNNLSSTLPTDTRPYRHTILQSATAKYYKGQLTVMARLLHSFYMNDAKDDSGAEDMRRLSPSLSLSYALTPQLRLRVSYKDIFRAPTFNENYFFHYGSKNLKAEDTKQLNLGATYAVNPSQHTELCVTADLYNNWVTDMIVGVPYNMFVWTCINVGKVNIMGVDATAKASRLFGRHKLTATANYSLQRARNRTNAESPYYNNQIAYIPLHTGATSLGWENPWTNFAVSVHAVGDRWTSNEHLDGTKVKGYGELNLTAWRQFHIGMAKAEVRADVKNLLDYQYEIVKSYPMPGRSWLLTLNVKI